MPEELFTNEERRIFVNFFKFLCRSGGSICLRQDLLDRFSQHVVKSRSEKENENTALVEFMQRVQEAFCIENDVFLFHRPEIALHRYIRVDVQKERISEISVSDYLNEKDRLIPPDSSVSNISYAVNLSAPLVIDLAPGDLYPEPMVSTQSIGRGVEVIVDYCKRNVPEAQQDGGGELFSSLPPISKIVVVSPHGWFGQENVLGKPDTGGQVIYILDQVRGLERALKQQFARSGVEAVPKTVVLTRRIPNAGNTSCNQRLERINSTENGWILRVPFRKNDGSVLPDWTSRFSVWPYLDRFAAESEAALYDELQGKPDLVIGNYSDGNIVAALLSRAFDATLCTIAHALEKTKYLLSDLHWMEMEEQYHFSLHFISDLLAMNRSDFIITSTFQEIAGTAHALGQYESYQAFSLPGYFHVVSGTDITLPKFNVNPPGVDEDNYFPHNERSRRDQSRIDRWERRLFLEKSPDIFGELENPEKPPVFSMARLDKIKNLSGLVAAFGENRELNAQANLIIAGGTTKLEESQDEEEKQEIAKIYGLAERYGLQRRIRWLPSIGKDDTGEVYRVMADRYGVFVQPALFEGFGLTVLEAMLSGLPTFATMFGGPSEIIEDGVSGFLINPQSPGSFTRVLSHFIQRSQKDSSWWRSVSEAGIRRVREHFTWPLYCERLVTMGKVYGFWRNIIPESTRRQSGRYWDVLYHFLMKQRADSIS
jgi:sucrose synthase